MKNPTTTKSALLRKTDGTIVNVPVEDTPIISRLIANGGITKWMIGILLAAFALFSTSCIYIEDPVDDVIIHTADLEVQLKNPFGYVIRGAEITLYHNYEDAVDGLYPLATGYTDHYGVAIFPDLPIGCTYFTRAQGPTAFSIGSVFIDRQGLFVIPMELP